MVDEAKATSNGSFGSRVVLFIKKYWLTAIAFLAFSVINVIMLFRYHWLFGGQDLQFHLQRIDEMYHSLINGNWNPYLATFNFNQLGSAVMSLYPKLPLYLFAIIRLVVKDAITGYYLGIILMTFLGLWVSYAAYHSVRKADSVGAYIFAIAYELSGLNITYNFLSADIGISFTYLILPLAFAGYYHWVTAGKFRMLATAMTIICLSHVLNTLITVLALVIFLIVDIKKVNRQKLLNLGKAVGITVLLSSSFWVPALHFGTSIKMTKPFAFPLNGINLLQYTTAALSNNITYGFTIVALLGFTYLFSSIGSALLKRVPKRTYQLGILSILTLVVLGLSLNSQAGRVNFERKSPEIKADLYPDSNQMPLVQGIFWYRVTNLRQYRHMMTYLPVTDYLPKMSDDMFKTLAMQRAIQDNNPAVNIPVLSKSHSKGKKMNVDIGTPIKSLALPFVIYDRHYTVTLDGKRYPVKVNQNHVLTINHLSVGEHTIRVSYHNDGLTAIICGLTLLGLMAILLPQKWPKTTKRQ